jgi:hypothetical protein
MSPTRLLAVLAADRDRNLADRPCLSSLRAHAANLGLIYICMPNENTNQLYSILWVGIETKTYMEACIRNEKKIFTVKKLTSNWTNRNFKHL